MITTREQIVRTTKMEMGASDKKAKHVIGSIAENLEDGDYVIYHHPILIFFIRVDDWTPDIYIEQIDFSDSYEMKLSNGRLINFYRPQIKSALKAHNKFRVVLLSNKGFSKFEINLR